MTWEAALQGLIFVIGIIGLILLLLGAVLFAYMLLKRTQDNSRGEFKYGSIVVKLPGPIVLCGVGIVAIVVSVSLYEPSGAQATDDGPPSHTSTPPPSAASSTASPPTASSSITPPVTAFVVDDPQQDAGVHGDFPMSGRSPDLNGDELWIFVRSDGPTGGLVYYKTSDNPIPVSAGTWATQQASLGSDEDIGMWFDLVAVRANPACQALILNVKPDSGGNLIVGRDLPVGCSELAVRRVKKTG
jgi:hypothetical protein